MYRSHKIFYVKLSTGYIKYFVWNCEHVHEIFYGELCTGYTVKP